MKNQMRSNAQMFRTNRSILFKATIFARVELWFALAIIVPRIRLWTQQVAGMKASLQKCEN